VGKADERQQMLAVLAALEKSILSRKEQIVGLDVSLAIALWRLIGLWHGAETLIEGQAYCSMLYQRLSQEKEESDPVVRQVSSALAFISRLRSGEIGFESKYGEVKVIDESAEFAAMLTAMALDERSRGDVRRAEVILNELVWFYSDAVSDASRRIGEMLWLLQETDLREHKQYTVSLVRQAQSIAKDEYLESRLFLHLKRIFELIDDEDYRMEVLSTLIFEKNKTLMSESKNSVAEIKRMLSLAASKSYFAEESKAETKSDFANMIWKSKSIKTLQALQKCAERKDWRKFAAVFDKESNAIHVDKCFYRLVELGLKAVGDFQILQSEKIVDLLLSHVTPSCVHAVDHLVEKLKCLLVSSENLYEASDLLQKVLSNKHQSALLKNRLRIQLAEVHVSMGNLFEATTLIYLAFSEIPEPEYGGAEPPLLS
jgi:hypothetical protein